MLTSTKQHLVPFLREAHQSLLGGMGNSFTGSLVSEILPLVSGEQALFLTADSKRPLGSLLEVGFPGGSCCKKVSCSFSLKVTLEGRLCRAQLSCLLRELPSEEGEREGIEVKCTLCHGDRFLILLLEFLKIP